MKNGLARARTYVVQRAVSIFNVALARDFGGDQMAISD